MLLRMFNPHFTSVLTIGLALALGCGAIDLTTPPDEGAELEYAAELERQRPVSVTDVYLDQALAELCGVDVRFEFDDAVVESGAASFGDLAACLNDGALSGRSFELFAHASPETDAFTRYHGSARIDSVREHLIHSGVAAADLSIHAEGPVDERRVNIRVLPRHYR